MTKAKRIAAFLLMLSLPLVTNAQVMTSPNYTIPIDAFSSGGGSSSSANFSLDQTISENSSPTGEGLSSANYLACVGYQCLFGAAPFINATIATSAFPCSATTTGGTMTAPLGTLSTEAVSTSSNFICVIVSTNTVTSLVVAGRDDFAALESTSVPTDKLPSATATLAPGTEGYGFCSSNAQNGFTAVSPFNGSCNVSTNHSVGGITTSDQTIWSATGPMTDAFGELLAKASISGIEPPHSDYADTLTLTITGTF